MGYIMELRKAVGHRELIQVGASVILEDAQGRILLQKRRDSGTWAYHGGSVEPGEETEACARRELLEETGIVAGKMTLYGVFSGEDLRHTYPNGDQVANIDIVYHCRDYSGTLKMQEDEVEELRFFPISELPENLFPPIAKALRKWQREQLHPAEENEA